MITDDLVLSTGMMTDYIQYRISGEKRGRLRAKSQQARTANT